MPPCHQPRLPAKLGPSPGEGKATHHHRRRKRSTSPTSLAPTKKTIVVTAASTPRQQQLSQVEAAEVTQVQVLVLSRNALCANVRCSFAVNSNPEFGAFCCWSCWGHHARQGHALISHGPRCERRPLDLCTPRAVPNEVQGGAGSGPSKRNKRRRTAVGYETTSAEAASAAPTAPVAVLREVPAPVQAVAHLELNEAVERGIYGFLELRGLAAKQAGAAPAAAPPSPSLRPCVPEAPSADPLRWLRWCPPAPPCRDRDRRRGWASASEGRRRGQWECAPVRHAKLPVAQFRQQIVEAIRANPVAIIRGETGSGKTTQVPRFIVEEKPGCLEFSACRVAVALPRRVAVLAAAERVAWERGEAVGESIGYAVRGDEVLPRRKDRCVTFFTAGLLRRRFRHGAAGFSHIVIDEAHERNFDADLLLLLAREVLREGSASASLLGLRVVVMSATMDAARIEKYFREPLPRLSAALRREAEEADREHENWADPVAAASSVRVIDVPGRMHPVNTLYLEDLLEALDDDTAAPDPPDPDLPLGVWAEASGNASWTPAQGAATSAETMRRVRRVDERLVPLPALRALLRRLAAGALPVALAAPAAGGADDAADSDGGAVLVFLPGRGAIDAAARFLWADADLREACLFVKLHADASAKEQRAAFAQAPWGQTKVVLATSVAETSITIPDVIYVVDSGLCRVPRAVPVGGGAAVAALDTAWATRTSVEQRRGRAGRVRPGVCVRLFTRQRLEQLPKEQPPELTRCPLHQLVLQARAMGAEPAALLARALDPPSRPALEASERELRRLGALTAKGGLTALGRVLERLPLTEPGLGVALVAGCLLGLARPMAAVVAAMTARDPTACRGDPEKSSAARKWADLAMELGADVLGVAAALGAVERGEVTSTTRKWSCLAKESYRRQVCTAAGLSNPAMQEMTAARQQLLQVLGDCGLVADEEKGWTWSGEDAAQAPAPGVDELRAAWPALSTLLAHGLGWSLGHAAGGKHLKVALRASGASGSEGVRTRKALIDRRSAVRLEITEDSALYVYGSTMQGGWGPLICHYVLRVSPVAAVLGCARAEEPCPPQQRADDPARARGSAAALLNGWLPVRCGRPGQLRLLRLLREAHVGLLEEVADRCFQRPPQPLWLQLQQDGHHAEALAAWKDLLWTVVEESTESPLARASLGDQHDQ